MFGKPSQQPFTIFGAIRPALFLLNNPPPALEICIDHRQINGNPRLLLRILQHGLDLRIKRTYKTHYLHCPSRSIRVCIRSRFFPDPYDNSILQNRFSIASLSFAGLNNPTSIAGNAANATSDEAEPEAIVAMIPSAINPDARSPRLPRSGRTRSRCRL